MASLESSLGIAFYLTGLFDGASPLSLVATTNNTPLISSSSPPELNDKLIQVGAAEWRLGSTFLCANAIDAAATVCWMGVLRLALDSCTTAAQRSNAERSTER